MNKWVKISDYLFFQEGPGVRNNQYTSEGVKLLNVANLVNGEVDLSTSNRYILVEEAYGKYKHFLADESDLIIASSGIKVEYFDKKMGFIKKEHLPICMNTSTIRFKSLDINKLNINYFMYYLKSQSFKSQLSKQITGSAQLNFGPSHLKKMKFPIVSLNEQLLINSILGNLDDQIRLKEKQIIEYDSLIKSRFVEMFDGKGLPVLKWNDVFNTTTGKLDSNAMVDGGQYPFFTCAKEIYAIDKYAFDKEALLLAGNNAAGKYDVKYYKGKFNAYQRTYVLDLKQNWSYQLFKYQLEDKLEFLREQSKGSNTRYITLKILADLDFIIPPLEKQVEFEKFCNHVDKLKFENEILYSIYRFTINKQTKLLGYRGVTL